MKTKIYAIEGMSCASCVNRIEKKVRNLTGVEEVNVNLLSKSMTVVYSQDSVTPEIEATVKKLGFGISSVKKEKKSYRTYVVAFNILAGILSLFLMHFSVPLLIILTFIVVGLNLHYYVNGFRNLVQFDANMDSLIALSTSTAIIYSLLTNHLYYDSAIMIIAFISLGKALEERAKSKTNFAMEGLLKLQVKQAHVLVDDTEQDKDLTDIKKGDILVVRTGERVPLDGTIIKGEILIDDSDLSGESLAKLKVANDLVIGGSIVKNGYAQILVDKEKNDTVLSHIITMVNTAMTSKPKLARLADKVASVFVPTVIVLAIATYIVWSIVGSQELAIKFAVSLLVISCPCAIGLATPTSIMVGTGKAASRGILFKNSEILENMNKANIILFDKTGTLTTGKLQVTETNATGETLSILKSLEQLSNHPYAEAVLAYTQDTPTLPVTNYQNFIGRGISGEINGKTYYLGNQKFLAEHGVTVTTEASIYLADSEQELAYIIVKDQVKPESKETVSQLQKRGFKVYMVTGDNEHNAQAVAQELGIDKVYAQVLPNEKYQIVETLQQQGDVIMVGDGVNDAPALAKANVGIALSSGTDIAAESADVLILRNSLTTLLESIVLAQKIITNIKQNLFWAFIYNVIAIPVAAGVFMHAYGIELNPIIASIAMSISSISVLLNALSLKLWKGVK